MLSVFNLFKSYNSNIVINDVSFSLEKDTRAGLVGANGCGKTTLLKIISGLETADSGQIIGSSSLAIGYLPQTLADLPFTTLESFFLSSSGIEQLQKRINSLEAEITRASGDNASKLIIEYGEVSERFRDVGGYEINHKILEMMDGLGIGYLELSREIETLSGGEKTRLSLAAVLLKSPDLLILDEPTNNLDTQSLAWLEQYLNSSKCGMIIASHDREFLNNTVNVIYEIDEPSYKLTRYAGNYDAYKLIKDREKAQQAAKYLRQQDEIKELQRTVKQTASESVRHRKYTKDHEKFAVTYKEGNREHAASRSIRNAEERLRRILDDPVPKPAEPLHFRPDVRFNSIKSADVIRASAISKSYGAKNIFQNISVTVGHNTRILITGSNGAGKTTLLRILTGEDIPDEGHVKFAPAVRIGYPAQEPDRGDADTEIVDCWLQRYGGTTSEAIYNLVICGLFQYKELNKKMGELSLGQLRKLEIAGLIAIGPNVLILDEPTNHLSLDVLESFENAVRQFTGPVIAVSHDRRFAGQFGGEWWELKNGKLHIT